MSLVTLFGFFKKKKKQKFHVPEWEVCVPMWCHHSEPWGHCPGTVTVSVGNLGTVSILVGASVSHACSDMTHYHMTQTVTWRLQETEAVIKEIFTDLSQAIWWSIASKVYLHIWDNMLTFLYLFCYFLFSECSGSDTSLNTHILLMSCNTSQNLSHFLLWNREWLGICFLACGNFQFHWHIIGTGTLLTLMQK